MDRLDTGDLAIVPSDGHEEDELRHYVAITSVGGTWFVGNGSHVKDVSRSFTSHIDAFTALSELAYEPDPPILTPRILAVIEGPDIPSGWIGVGAARRGSTTDLEHVWLQTSGVSAGWALSLRTYIGDRNDPRTHAEPTWRSTEHTVRRTAEELWNRLHPEVRVLVVAVDLTTGEAIALERDQPQYPRIVGA